MPSDQTDKCVRCSSELAEGETFCATCGHTNTGRTQQRLAETELELDRRWEHLGFLNRIVGWLRIFPRK